MNKTNLKLGFRNQNYSDIMIVPGVFTRYLPLTSPGIITCGRLLALSTTDQIFLIPDQMFLMVSLNICKASNIFDYSKENIYPVNKIDCQIS